MEAISLGRLEECHPLLREKVMAMDVALLAQQIEIRIVQGLRTYAEQDAIFAQIPKVTNARSGYSMHNFGLAVDCVPDMVFGEPWQPDWSAKDEHYARMVAAGVAQGLVAGANWHTMVDMPHMQLAGLPVTPSDQMRADFAAGGLELVWQQFDSGVYAPSSTEAS